MLPAHHNPALVVTWGILKYINNILISGLLNVIYLCPNKRMLVPGYMLFPAQVCHFLQEAIPKHLTHNGTLVPLLFLQQHSSLPGSDMMEETLE